MRAKMDYRRSTHNSSILIAAIGFICISGILAQNSGEEESNVVRVMVHKEFQLQPDGTYREVPSENKKTISSRRDEYEEDESVAESAPSVQYYKSSYGPYSYGLNSNYAASSLKPYVLQPQTAPLNRFSYNGESTNEGNLYSDEQVDYPSSQTKSTFYTPTPNYVQGGNGSQPQSSNGNHQYKIQQGTSEYYVDDGSIRPLTSEEAYSLAPLNESQGQGTEARSHYSAPYQGNVQPFEYQGAPVSNGYSPPSNIQEILKKPAASHNTPYYSPKDQLYYEPLPESKLPIAEYDAPGGDFGGQSHGPPILSQVHAEFHSELKPGVGGYENLGFEGVQGDYGAPVGGLGGDGGYGAPVGGHGGDGGYGAPAIIKGDGGYGQQGGHGHGGGIHGIKAGIVGNIAQTVKGVAGQKAHQFSSVLQQKGEIGSQLLQQKGYAVKAAVNQKAQKAKIIVNTLSQAPAKFSSILSTKAHLASAALAHKGKKLATIVQIKSQIANQASGLIQAKGKAASAVIKASGGTAADLIVAKGKGIAHLINTGGRTAAAILNHKGNKVSQVANVLGGLAAQKAHKGHGGGGYESAGGYEAHGGYESQDRPAVEHSPQPFQQLQYALKSVVESPASSYGSPPEGHSGIQSAFQSMYNNYKSGQHQPSSFPLGAYSSPVGVTAEGSSGGTATSITNSLTNLSEMFTNISKVFKRLSPESKEE